MTQNNLISKINNEKNWFYYQINYVNSSSKADKTQKIKNLPEFDDNDNFGFAYTHTLSENKRTLMKQIKTIIKEAMEKNTYVLICSFMINCNEIIELIKNASYILRGKIYIIVGSQQYSFISYNKNSELVDKGFSTLVDSGVLIRHMNNAHLKFITNGEKSLICTTNFTEEGLFKNPEFGLVFNTQNIAKSLNRLFSYLWFGKCEFMLINNIWFKIPKESRHIPLIKSVRNIPNKIIISSKSIITDLNHKTDILHKNNAYDNLIELLNSAEKTIDIAVYIFSIYSNSELKKIKEILLKKVKDSKKIRILVPAVQVNYNKDMKNLLNDFKKIGIAVRYYRELHGKCFIIDEKRVFLFTGNIDKYLVQNDSYDIGYITEEPALVKNFLTFYNHLWGEAADECQTNTPIDLQLDLVVKSYELISFKPLISVRTLEQRINQCKNIQFYWHEKGFLLSIKDAKEMELNLYFDINEPQSYEHQGKTLYLTGIICDKPHIYRKDAIVNTVNKLNLKLFWEY